MRKFFFRFWSSFSQFFKILQNPAAFRLPRTLSLSEKYRVPITHIIPYRGYFVNTALKKFWTFPAAFRNSLLETGLIEKDPGGNTEIQRIDAARHRNGNLKITVCQRFRLQAVVFIPKA